ncbi:MAG: M48 family metalloprotease [Deltaproteobacteria bacterium]|nr:M48 family metalloprotease [Deltaproteobacteria bacterium]
MDLVYKKEKTLYAILLIISIIAWLAIIVGTIGIALAYLLIFFIFYLFAQSALISYLKGNGVLITQDQFPDIHEQLVSCCNTLGLREIPEAYLLHADGAFNAFAARFLGRNFLVLFSDVVDALAERPESLKFYIGHELGHIARKHMLISPILAPGKILPLLGAAYSRAREYTCDNYGLHCCPNPEDAAIALSALAAGGQRWKTLSVSRFAEQSFATGGFFMSFHELTAGYPWLVKRVARIPGVMPPRLAFPTRHPLAFVFAAFVPNVGAGNPIANVMVTAAIIGVLAAIAIPNFIAYQKKSYDAAANADIKNAYIAAQAFFTDNPGGAVDENLLKQSGYVPTPGVSLEIMDGTRENLMLAAFHEEGKNTYTVNAEGNISSDEDEASEKDSESGMDLQALMKQAMSQQNGGQGASDESSEMMEDSDPASNDAKMAYMAAQAYFVQNPDAQASLEALAQVGFTPSEGVEISVSGNQAGLAISASQKDGEKVYSLDASGQITTTDK